MGQEILRINTNKSKPFFENLMTLEELRLALREQYSKHTLYKWVEQGMPKRKIGGKLWFDRERVFQWIVSHKED